MSCCDGCGAAIRWVKTTRGRNAPIDAAPFWLMTPQDPKASRDLPDSFDSRGLVAASGYEIVSDGAGGEVGRIVRGYRCKVTDPHPEGWRVVCAWVPHFAVCPRASSFRK